MLWLLCCLPVLTGCIGEDVYKRQVSKVLKKSADNTMDLLKQELEIKKGEILESLHFSSLEKIFIEERIYKDKELSLIHILDQSILYLTGRARCFSRYKCR